MDKAYNHNGAEDKIYGNWENSGKMKADPNSPKPPFTIPLPPPNVTGNLHLGHAAMLAIEDIMIRYKKMQGHEVLWLPGTDHAAIATENVVIKHHGKKSREEWPSREAFLEDCRTFAGEKHDNIVNQMKKMGSWLDWSREAYTFDEERNFAVNTIFKSLFDDGLIERGHRLINWSTGAQSVLSDDELEWDEVKEPFFYIKCGEFIIGTVRPETKCADSPLIVHPDSKYIRAKFTNNDGQEETYIVIENLFNDEEKRSKILNLLDAEGTWEILETFSGSELEGQEFEYDTYAGRRKFYVIADEVIDPEKGAGAMTISASHSADDYDLAKRKKLDETFIQKIDFEGKMTDIAGPCAGLSIEDARIKSGQLMKDQGLLVGIDKGYQHRVPLCYRSNCVVEPMISPQWFIMVEKEYQHPVDGKTTLKAQMQAAVRQDHVQIIPNKFDKEYFRWIDNLQDWCISRQIWWGHRIPVWYDENDQIVATGFLTPEQEKLNLRQDEDTLDTWFSSALWPFSTLGWPNDENPDFQKFFNNAVNGQGTDVLETGWDILFFWVARMIMFSRYATGKYPFHTVYLHGMVTDEHGKKMSKSKGNGIDPLGMIDKFGADPVRLALVIGSSPGNPIPIGENKIKGYRNFVNKLWNAGRFAGIQADEFLTHDLDGNKEKFRDLVKEPQLEYPETIAGKWIYNRFQNVSREVQEHLDKYEISSAGDKIYHFVWSDFCDWFLECQKTTPDTEFLCFIYVEILKLAHPLCPFVTEKIWQELMQEGSITEESFPQLELYKEEQGGKQLFYEEFFKDVEAFETVQKIIGAIRSIRASNKLNPKEKLKVSGKIYSAEVEKLIEALAGVKFESIEGETVKIVEGNIELNIGIPVDENRQAKEIEDLKKKIANLEGRLNNKAYVDKAPEALVNQTRQELADAQEKLKKLS